MIFTASVNDPFGERGRKHSGEWCGDDYGCLSFFPPQLFEKGGVGGEEGWWVIFFSQFIRDDVVEFDWTDWQNLLAFCPVFSPFASSTT